MLSPVQAQPRYLNFRHLSINNGLSEGNVTSIYLDSKGFLWIGTKDGLNRYDGYDFKVFQHNHEDERSISSNYITSIVEDEAGHLWIGTLYGGLNLYVRDKEQFQRYLADPNIKNSLTHNDVTCLMTDDSHRLWIGTAGGGLNLFTPKRGVIKPYFHEPADLNSIGSNHITCIERDENGIMWVGTLYGGLNRFDPVTGMFERYSHDRNKQGSLSNDNIHSLAIDHEGSLWVGTEAGLDILQRPSNKFITCMDPSFQNCISNIYINALEVDHQGRVWIGTANGLNLYSPTDGKGFFKAYFHDENDPKSISNNTVISLLETNDGSVWVGTAGEGLNVVYEYSQKFETVKAQPDLAGLSAPNVRNIIEPVANEFWVATRGGGIDVMDSLLVRKENIRIDARANIVMDDNFVNCILKASDGTFWIGSENRGLVHYDRSNGRFGYYKNDPLSSNSLSHNNVMCLLEDEEGVIWAGTKFGGLNKLDQGNGTFKRYKHNRDNPQSLSHDEVTCLFKDDDGSLWVGTANGLNHFYPDKGTFVPFYQAENDTNSLSDNFIKCITKDKNGVYWIGTMSGLNRWDQKSNTFQRWGTKDGLANAVVYGILIDAENRIWCSTNQGISRLNQATNQFTNYNAFDGLQGNEFNTGAYLKAQDGRLMFGGLNGLNAFDPGNLQNNKHVPPVRLTRLTLFNKEVAIGEQEILDRSISYAKEIHLRHDHSVFSLEFSALNYTWPEKNQYSWKLEGFNDSWTNIGNRRFVTFTNLDPDDYVFHVRGSNNDGVWNDEGATLIIHIHPAYYQTWWFQLLVVAFIVLVIVIIIRMRTRNVKKVNQHLEELVDERTSEILKEKEAKERLLKEIHHRVKNNLQVITSLLRLQSHRLSDPEALAHFEESQNRIISMALIHEKMYESRDLAHINIGEYFDELTKNLINSYRLRQVVDLEMDVSVNNLGLDTLTPLGLIVNELISNSLKYGFVGRDHGTIYLKLKRLGGRQLELIIGDDGVGLPDHINLEEPESLGLELVKGLVDQLDGTMQLLDEPGTMYKINVQDYIRKIESHPN